MCSDAAADRVPWSLDAGGLSVTVRLTPKGGRDSIDSIERLSDGRMVLKVRVRAPPHEGAANAALIRLIAKAAGVTARAVTISAGATSRIKRLTIAGEGPALAKVLQEIVSKGCRT